MLVSYADAPKVRCVLSTNDEKGISGFQGNRKTSQLPPAPCPLAWRSYEEAIHAWTHITFKKSMQRVEVVRFLIPWTILTDQQHGCHLFGVTRFGYL